MGLSPLVSLGQRRAAGALTIRASRAVDRVFNKIIEIIQEGASREVS